MIGAPALVLVLRMIALHMIARAALVLVAPTQAARWQWDYKKQRKS